MSNRRAQELYEEGCILKDALKRNESMDRLKQSMDLSADDPELLKKIADQFVALQDYALGEEAIRRTLVLSPRDPETWQRLGKLFVLKGDDLEARIAFRYARQFKRITTLESAIFQTAILVIDDYVRDLAIYK
jgi:tetratricopeptide (TPR) repeat protein